MICDGLSSCTGSTHAIMLTAHCLMQEASFEKARQKTKEAEQAARIAQANADKAIKLLHASEESSRLVDEFRKEREMKLRKLEELAAQVLPPPPPFPGMSCLRSCPCWPALTSFLAPFSVSNRLSFMML